MKHFLFLLAVSILSISISLAQVPASGTIEFQASNTSGSVDVELVGAQAQSLETSDIYNIDGITNEAIPFNWEVLGLEEFAEVYGTYINPSGAFDGVFSNPLGSTFNAGIYSLLGQRISTPQVTYKDNQVRVYDGLEGVAEGMYIVTLLGSNGESESIRFIKKGNGTDDPKSISDEVINKEKVKENPFEKPRMADNFNIIWDDGYGVEQGSQAVTISAGSGNVIDITTGTLENPYYTANGSITGGTNGTATYDTDGGDQYTAPITGTTFTLTDIISQFDNVNAVDDVHGDLTLQGSYGTFQSALDLTTDGEGEIIVNLGEYNVGGSSGTGNIVIAPDLDGFPQVGFTCNITNDETNQSFELTTQNNEVFVYFTDLPIETLPSDTYNGIIVDTDPDPEFLPTSFSVDVFEGNNPGYSLDLNIIPNQQDITTVIRDYQSLAILSGVTVEIRNFDTDALIDTQVSDANGEVVFNNIPGQTEVYLVNSKTGYYKKRNKTYNVPLVDRVSKQDTLLNMTAVELKTLANGDPFPADRFNVYRPLADNTEIALGNYKKHYPADGNRLAHIAHEEGLLALLGRPGILDASAITPYPDPHTNGTFDLYQPYPENRNIPSTIGTNVTDYTGTSNLNGTKTLPNGNNITFFTLVYDLGGLDWSRTDHEHGNAYGFPLLSVPWATSRDPVAAISVAVADSENDQIAMSTWFRLQQLNYDTTDGQGRIMDYNMTYSFED